MATKLNPYLSFKNNARAAMEFYHSIFGGKLDIRTFKDFQASQDPSEDDLVMHSVLEAENGLELMASDTPQRITYQAGGNNFSLSLSGEDEPELSGYFKRLAEGGQVTMPLEKAIWGDTFGMCTDKFGIGWIVNISAKPE
jgi:PhnB protein